VTRRGAYGLALAGLPDAGDLLVDAPEAWPLWHIDRRRGDDAATGQMDGDSASLPLDPSGRLEVGRDAAHATLTLPDPPSDAQVAHPYLAPIAAIAAHWSGRLSFHAGAVAVDGAAWALLGDRGAGKSSLLASLAGAGLDVLADDLVVVTDGRALAAPRCVDLREDAARALGAGALIGRAGGRDRWRVGLGSVPAEVPFAGFVELGWGQDVAVAQTPPHERVPLLLRSLALRTAAVDREALLDFVAAPMLRLARPRRWDAQPAAVEALVAALAAAAVASS
jgi:hypothetical protein